MNTKSGVAPILSPLGLNVASRGCAAKVEERSFLRLFRSLSSSRGLDDSSKFVSHELSAFVSTCSLASKTYGLLLFVGITSLEQLHHLALERRESGDLNHDLTDGQDTLVKATLAMGLVLLESIWMRLWLRHDVPLVQTDKNSCFLHHLISFKIIMNEPSINCIL